MPRQEILLAGQTLDQAQMDKAQSFADAVGLEIHQAVMQQKLAEPEAVMMAYAESIGLLAFRGDGAARFRHAIERAMRTKEGTTIWYLRVIHHLAQDSDVWTLDIAGEEWGEVDFPEDVAAFIHAHPPISTRAT